MFALTDEASKAPTFTSMCYTLSGRVAYCRCTIPLSDKTLTRMRDVALMNNRTACKTVSFLFPERYLTDPTCHRCSRDGHITIFIDPSATRRTSEGQKDAYNVKDLRTELNAQLKTAALCPLASPAPVNDEALDEDFEDASSFVEVEYSDAAEQFDEEGISAPIPGGEDDINKFSARSSSPIQICKGFSQRFVRSILGI